MNATEYQDERTPLGPRTRGSRPVTQMRPLQHPDGRAAGFVGAYHGELGTVAIEREGDVTTYTTARDGYLHRRRELVGRSERGAAIMAGKWLRELAGLPECDGTPDPP